MFMGFYTFGTRKIYKSYFYYNNMSKREISLDFLISASCACLILSLVFLSVSLTGNAIGAVSVRASSQASSVLFLFGILGVFSWVRKNKS